MTISNTARQQKYASVTLEFLKTIPSFGIELTADEFNAHYEKSEMQSLGAQFGVAIQYAMNKTFIRRLIQDADIPFKDFYRDQLTKTIRVLGTHSFIVDVLGKDNPDSELIKYSEVRLNKTIDVLEEWSGKSKRVQAGKHVDSDTATINHPLESVSAMREMRQLVDTVKISIVDFDEARVKKSSTKADGSIDYKMVSAQLRHNFTNYDVLRISRKVRRNTYWKLTAQSAIRIAVCEKLLLMTEDPALHLQLMKEIELANAEFQKKLTSVAKASNFTAAIDDIFIRTTKRRIVKKSKCAFMLCLETI